MLSKKTLPTNGEVLRRLMHLRFIDKLTIDSSLDHVVEEIMRIWKKFCVMTRVKSHVKIVVHKLYSDYHLVKKNRARRSTAQIQRETKLQLKFPALLDIAHEGIFFYQFNYNCFSWKL